MRRVTGNALYTQYKYRIYFLSCFVEASFIWVFSQSKVFRESPRAFDIVVAVLSLHFYIFTIHASFLYVLFHTVHIINKLV